MTPDCTNVYKIHTSLGESRILVVDDDATTRKILRKMLDNSGYVITEAASGEGALQHLNTARFSLVLLDIVMRDMDGISVLKTIRQKYSMSELPVIMVTVKAERDDIMKALSLGANDYVVKPIDFPVLHARIESHISHKRLEDELRLARNELEQRVKERTATLRATNKALKNEIAARKQVEQDLRETTEYFQSLIEHAQDIILVFEEDGTIYYESPSVERVLGYRPEERIGQNTLDLIHPEDHQTVADKLALVFTSPGSTFSETFRVQHKDGSWRLLETIGSTAIFHGDLRGFVNARDITERNQLTEQLFYQSNHDALTGLFNRREFKRRLTSILELSRAIPSESVLLYLDLDQFKVINEICGDIAGDELLKQVSGLLCTEVRKRDIVARVGGNEFGILLEHCPLDQAHQIAIKLHNAIGNFRFSWADRIFAVGASIGLVSITGTSDDNIIEHAEAACYAAQAAGGDRIHLYHEGDMALSQRHGEMQWVAQINQALETDRFCLFMQPIVPVTEHDVSNSTHYELLLRMRGEGTEVIPPDSFLAVAERYNLSTRLDRWVIEYAFNWLVDNPSHLKQLSQCAINLSGLSLGNDDFLTYLVQQFKETAIAPEKICFEVTETAAIANLSSATKFINTLKELGCRFALDDFGSGLSSFAYLKNLPVDYLKIDGMFVKDMETNPIDLAMVKSINDIGKSMGKQTIAEFVETQGIIIKLKEIGVDYAQGYYIGKPVPIELLI